MEGSIGNGLVRRRPGTGTDVTGNVFGSKDYRIPGERGPYRYVEVFGEL